jgi:hypothetical protein
MSLTRKLRKYYDFLKFGGRKRERLMWSKEKRGCLKRKGGTLRIYQNKEQRNEEPKAGDE